MWIKRAKSAESVISLSSDVPVASNFTAHFLFKLRKKPSNGIYRHIYDFCEVLVTANNDARLNNNGTYTSFIHRWSTVFSDLRVHTLVNSTQFHAVRVVIIRIAILFLFFFQRHSEFDSVICLMDMQIELFFCFPVWLIRRKNVLTAWQFS